MSKSLLNLGHHAGRVAVIAAVAGLVLTGCGRKGNLDKPSTPIEQQNIRKDSKAPKEKTPEKPFILDSLL
ncbi:LPS translocon maturation chaperone LptM [Neorhizobium sp. NPDC001467]|uniref:LPS translocon maturation chaperone LptM n=1 Tax=Neorhizobium sp. NPDC001467 TaxID=3390595 RepID=UPI003D057897